jgi:hypothetical protein
VAPAAESYFTEPRLYATPHDGRQTLRLQAGVAVPWDDEQRQQEAALRDRVHGRIRRDLEGLPAWAEYQQSLRAVESGEAAVRQMVLDRDQLLLDRRKLLAAAPGADDLARLDEVTRAGEDAGRCLAAARQGLQQFRHQAQVSRAKAVAAARLLAQQARAEVLAGVEAEQRRLAAEVVAAFAPQAAAWVRLERARGDVAREGGEATAESLVPPLPAVTEG